MLSRLKTLLAGIDRLVYPPVCLVCSTPFTPTNRYALCDECHRAVSVDPFETCPRCCSSIGPHVATNAKCLKCAGDSFAFDGSFRLGPYDGRLREAVIQMKHSTAETTAETLGLIWADRDRQKFADHGIELVVPVPLHWRRRIVRGYNQSAAVAESIAMVLGVRCQGHALKRVRPTPKQFTQSATARRENLRDAFRTTRSARVRDRRVLLVDDVLTTGATCHEAAKALKAAGAAQVWAAVLAHR